MSARLGPRDMFAEQAAREQAARFAAELLAREQQARTVAALQCLLAEVDAPAKCWPFALALLARSEGSTREFPLADYTLGHDLRRERERRDVKRSSVEKRAQRARADWKAFEAAAGLNWIATDSEWNAAERRNEITRYAVRLGELVNLVLDEADARLEAGEAADAPRAVMDAARRIAECERAAVDEAPATLEAGPGPGALSKRIKTIATLARRAVEVAVLRASDRASRMRADGRAVDLDALQQEAAREARRLSVLAAAGQKRAPVDVQDNAARDRELVEAIAVLCVEADRRGLGDKVAAELGREPVQTLIQPGHTLTAPAAFPSEPAPSSGGHPCPPVEPEPGGGHVCPPVEDPAEMEAATLEAEGNAAGGDVDPVAEARRAVDVFEAAGCVEFAWSLIDEERKAAGAKREEYVRGSSRKGRRLTPDALRAALSSLIPATHAGPLSLFVRPYGPVAQLDDRPGGVDVPGAFVELQTSPASKQRWVAIADVDAKRARAIGKRIAAKIGADVNATGSTRWPGSRNNKPGRGGYVVRLEAVEDPAPTTVEELERAGVLDPEPPRAARAVSSSDRPNASAEWRGWPSWDKCLKARGGNSFLADIDWCLISLDRGHAPAAVADELERVSPRAKRESKPADYAEATVAKAIEGRL